MTSAISDPRVSMQFSHFLKRHTNGIAYMQCDRCVFICRPMGSLFLKHYHSHFSDETFPFSDHISDSPAEDNIGYQALLPSADASNESLTSCNQSATKKTFACKWCEMKFHRKEELIMHHRQCYHCQRSSQPLPLICDYCGKHFRSKDGFKYHRLNRCVRYECKTAGCGHKSFSKASLKTHMKEAHDSELSDQQWRNMDQGAAKSMCFVCGKITKDMNMERHMLVHTEEKPFECDLCGKRFKMKSALRDHIMNKLGMRDYVCEICGRAFVKPCYLNKHMRYHLTESKPSEEKQQEKRPPPTAPEMPEKVVECDLCCRTFPSEEKLSQHSQREVICLMCDEILASNDLLRQHVLSAHTVEEYRNTATTTGDNALQPSFVYPCDLCGRRFASEQRLQQHAQSETQCELCARNFANERDLKGHVESDHDLTDYRKIVSLRWRKRIRRGGGIDSKEYICHLCGKKLFYKQTLLLHLRMHSGLKPYKCEYCGKAYTSKHSLNAHLVSEMNLRKYECSFCGKRYNFNSDLLVHVKQRHETRQFRCHVCDKQFGLFKYLKDHSTIHSHEKPFSCEHCNLRFRLKKFLLKHNRKYHSHKSDMMPSS